MTHTILPASGLASRMRGLPKFLLPCDNDYLTLLERHVQLALEHSEVVWIPTRPDLAPLIESLGLPSEKVVVLSMRTQTMTETVLRVAGLSSASRFMLAMPDTYFYGQLPWTSLANSKSSLHLACWKIRDDQAGKLGQVLIEKGEVLESKDKDPSCAFPHSWGAMSFSKEMLEFADVTTPHLGYFIQPVIDGGNKVTAEEMQGSYFDCGTPSEYLDLLKKIV